MGSGAAPGAAASLRRDRSRRRSRRPARRSRKDKAGRRQQVAVSATVCVDSPGAETATDVPGPTRHHSERNPSAPERGPRSGRSNPAAGATGAATDRKTAFMAPNPASESDVERVEIPLRASRAVMRLAIPANRPGGAAAARRLLPAPSPNRGGDRDPSPLRLSPPTGPASGLSVSPASGGRGGEATRRGGLLPAPGRWIRSPPGRPPAARERTPEGENATNTPR